MTPRESTIEGEVYTHRYLWASLKRVRDVAAEKDEDAPFFWLSAMLLAYLTYEAYLNYVGDRVAPEVWSGEKEVFSKGKYRGEEAKLRKIEEVTGIRVDKAKRPYQTVKKLKKVRDMLVHGKVEKFRFDTVVEEDTVPKMFQITLEEYVSKSQFDRALHDTEQLIEHIQQELGSKWEYDHLFPGKALVGSLASSTGNPKKKI